METKPADRNKSSFDFAGRRVWLYRDSDTPELLFLQPVDEHDAEHLDREAEMLHICRRPFIRIPDRKQTKICES